MASVALNARVFAAVADATPASEVAALEKKLAAARDEVAALKTALAVSKSQTEAAEKRAKVVERPDSEVDSLRSHVRVLERDLQSATTALKKLAAEKAAADGALRSGAPAAADRSRGASAPSAPPEAAASDAKIRGLDLALNEARAQLAAAEKSLEVRDAELASLRATLAARPPIPESVSLELTELRSRVASASEFEAQVRKLEMNNAALARRLADAGGSKDEFARVNAERGDMERQLAAAKEALATLMRNNDELRARIGKVEELEARLRQNEATRTSAAPAMAAGTGSDDVARPGTAQAAAESKLATVLRSYTLLTKERDELRARVAELTARLSQPTEKR